MLIESSRGGFIYPAKNEEILINENEKNLSLVLIELIFYQS